MAAEVSIHIFGDRIFERKIRKMAYRAMDMRPVMHDIGDDLQQIIEEQFATQGVRGGRKWNPLEFDTISRRGSAEPILIDKGDMIAEVLDDSNFKATHDSLEVTFPESARQKAESAQFGFHVGASSEEYFTATPKASHHVPPRPIVQLTEFDRLSFKRKITDYLVNGDRTQ